MKKTLFILFLNLSLNLNAPFHKQLETIYEVILKRLSKNPKKDKNININFLLKIAHNFEKFNNKKAFDIYKTILDLEPTNEQAAIKVTNYLLNEKNYKKALEILKLIPDNYYSYLSRATAYKELNQLENSIYNYEKAVKIKPDYKLFFELGNLLNKLGKTKQALAAYDKAINLSPNNLNILRNICFTLKREKRFEETLKIYEILLMLYPNNPETHLGLSEVYFNLGNFKKALPEYEWRLKNKHPDLLESHLRLKEAIKTNELQGKKILVISEGGIGDLIQFIRYLKILKNKGAFITLKTQSNLYPLLSECKYIDSFNNMKYDFKVALMSLPFVFDSQLKTIPQEIPYLPINQKKINFWKDRLNKDKKFKIGICFKGGADNLRHLFEYRSLPLNFLSHLVKLDKVSFYCLQRMKDLNEFKNLPKNIIVQDDKFDQEGSFIDTAALMKNLDLVITVDTSIAHLAGALGIKTWLLLPFSSDWRWMNNISYSPWYPTMKLFRQPNPGDWGNVIENILRELSEI